MMKKEQVIQLLIFTLTTGIVIGAVFIWVLIFFFGAKVKNVNVGPLDIEIPTATNIATDLPPSNNNVLPQTTQPSEQPLAKTETQNVLFRDDFENGIRPDWGMTGNNFYATNGDFTIADGSFESTIIGSSDWHNYKIVLNGYINQGTWIEIQFRVQDRDNYLSLKCNFAAAYTAQPDCVWSKFINGNSETITGTEFKIPDGRSTKTFFEIELENNAYRTFENKEQKIRFVDDTFMDGGIRILGQAGKKALRMLDFAIILLP